MTSCDTWGPKSGCGVLPPPPFFIDSISFIYLAGKHIFSMGNVFTTVNWVHIGIYLLWSLMQRPLGRILTKKLKVLLPRKERKHFHFSSIIWEVLGFSDFGDYV